jgi:hypothetical protein
VTYVESAKCRDLKWVVHVACVVWNLQRNDNRLKDLVLNLKIIYSIFKEIRFEVVDWINVAHVVDKYLSELLIRYHRISLYILFFRFSIARPKICGKNT